MALNKYSSKVCGIKSSCMPQVVNEVLSDNEFFEFTYKQGKGKFKIDTAILLVVFNQKEFSQVANMISTNENPQVLAGFLNSLLKKLYQKFNEEFNTFPADMEKIEKWFSKRNDILVKLFNVSPLNDTKEDKQTDIPTGNEIMSDLKRCNVSRFIPTQIKPVWENAKVESKIGYQFNYRGMDLQLVTNKGWVSENTVCKVFIIDPVVGLPITSYEGTITELEDRLSEVFINYLKTIESNKEFIVQVAKTFKELKLKAIA